jgi:hypothetical protein
MQTAIVPVPVFPGTANTLQIRGVGPVDDSGCPNYFWQLSDRQLVTPASPAVPATDDTPEVPAVEAVYANTPLTAGNIAMTANQWANWGKTTPDEPYQLSCISTNLGLTIATLPITK